MLFKVKTNASGFAIILVLILLGSTAAFILAFTSIRDSQHRTVNYLEHKDSADNLMWAFAMTTSGASCTCQVNADTTPDPGAVLTFDSSVVDGSQTVTFQAVRSGCLNTSPILAQVGANFESSYPIERIEIGRLQPVSGLVWQGRWTIHWRTTESGLPVAPSFQDLQIELDPVSAAATPAQTKIRSCVPIIGGTKLIAACAPGFTMIGEPNQVGTYCIDTEKRSPATTQAGAMAACGAVSVPSGEAKLCRGWQWVVACTSATPPNNMQTASWEWLPEFAPAGAVVIGGSNCSTPSARALNTDQNFRCCYP